MDIRRRAILPAWPVLGGLQLLMLIGLTTALIFTLPPRLAPVEERLAGLDLAQATTDVEAAIHTADSGRALLADDEQRTTMFLQLLSQAAELQLHSIQLTPGLREEALQTVDAVMELSGDPYNLPIFLDPSHALGYAYGIADLARASMAFGVEGLLIEAHPDPTQARSDASQQLDLDQLEQLHASLGPVAEAVSRRLT